MFLHDILSLNTEEIGDSNQLFYEWNVILSFEWVALDLVKVCCTFCVQWTTFVSFLNQYVTVFEGNDQLKEN